MPQKRALSKLSSIFSRPCFKAPRPRRRKPPPRLEAAAGGRLTAVLVQCMPCTGDKRRISQKLCRIAGWSGHQIDRQVEQERAGPGVPSERVATGDTGRTSCNILDSGGHDVRMWHPAAPCLESTQGQLVPLKNVHQPGL